MKQNETKTERNIIDARMAIAAELLAKSGLLRHERRDCKEKPVFHGLRSTAG